MFRVKTKTRSCHKESLHLIKWCMCSSCLVHFLALVVVVGVVEYVLSARVALILP